MEASWFLAGASLLACSTPRARLAPAHTGMPAAALAHAHLVTLHLPLVPHGMRVDLHWHVRPHR